MAQGLPVQQHVCPSVAVQVMDCAARADEQVALLAERAQRSADLDVVVRVVAGVGGDDGHGRAGGEVGEHPDEDQEGVVDPFEVCIGADGEAFGGEHGDAARGGG